MSENRVPVPEESRTPIDMLRARQVRLKLTREDGNAFFILGRAHGAAKKKGATAEEIAAFTKEASAGNYDHLLQTCMSVFVCR